MDATKRQKKWNRRWEKFGTVPLQRRMKSYSQHWTIPQYETVLYMQGKYKFCKAKGRQKWS
jgi:hypothetical protein